jgi:hypothetical protein
VISEGGDEVGLNNVPYIKKYKKKIVFQRCSAGTSQPARWQAKDRTGTYLAGSGAFLNPGPGSRISNPYFLELGDKFLGKKFYNSLNTRPNFFLQHFKKKIIFNFVKFVTTKKGRTTNFFSPLSFVEVFGSGIGDP